VTPEQVDSKGVVAPTSRAAWITLLVLLAGAAYLCFLVLRPFVEPLVAGGVMAVLFYPLHAAFVRRMPHRDGWAALLTTVIVVIAVLAPMAFVVSLVVRELRDAYQTLGADGLGGTAGRLWEAVQGPIATAAGWFGMTAEELREAILGRAQQGAAEAGKRAVAALGAATGGVISTVIALLTLFFALRHGRAFYHAVLVRSPLGMHRTGRLAGAAQQMIFASFYGVLAVATVQGILCAIGVWIAGLPSPPLWGFAAGIASVLPLFGSALVWLPAAALLFVQGSIGAGIFMIAWGALLVSSADNVVRPLVLMARMPTNALVILIAILGGVQAFGLIGIVLGPVTLAVAAELFGMLREEMGDVNGAS
jgi:predicted PurR-regulated permease PerM